MITPITITRGGIEYLVYRGIESGKSTTYIESVEANEKGVKERWSFLSLFITTDVIEGEGSVISMETKWRKVELYPNGNPILGTESIETVHTKQSDRESFNNSLGNPITMSIVNGVVVDTWGFNELPVYDTRPTIAGAANPNFGHVLTYTEIQENSAPTRQYHS